MNFVRIPVFLLLVLSALLCCGQNSQIEKDYFTNSNAKNYAVICSKYSTQAYHYSKNIHFEQHLSTAISWGDSAMYFVSKALEFAGKANANACDTCKVAMRFMNEAKKFLLEAEASLESVATASSPNDSKIFGQKAMYAAGNSILEAYNASFYLLDGHGLPATEAAKTENPADINQQVERLETDEATFTAITKMYEDRLRPIEEEIAALKKKLKAATDEKERERLLEEINRLIDERTIVENKLFESTHKMKEISDRLGELLAEKHNGGNNGPTKKSVFSTDKVGFYNDSNPIPVDEEISEELVFKLQIGYYSRKSSPQWEPGFYPVSGRSVSNNFIRYSTGLFYSYQDADNAKDKARQLGINDAFVIAFLDGKKISVAQAIRMAGQ